MKKDKSELLHQIAQKHNATVYLILLISWQFEEKYFCHREYKKNIDISPGPSSTVHLVPETGTHKDALS